MSSVFSRRDAITLEFNERHLAQTAEKKENAMVMTKNRRAEIMQYRLGEQMDVELASLAILDRVLIDRMDGVFAETGDNFAGMSHVLDVGSGSGTWAVRVARDNPALEVTGLESKQEFINYAQGQAEAQGI